MIGFFAFLMGLVIVILTLAGGLRWIDTRSRAVESGPDLRPELNRLEDALGRLEGRVDDLHEQQRFLERLLEERAPRGALPGGSGGEPGTDDASRISGGEDSILFDTDPSEREER